MRGGPAIGIDIGGTYVKSGLVKASGEVSNLAKMPVDKHSVENIINQIVSLVECRPTQTSATLAAVGIGVPGFINQKSGIIEKSPNLPALDGVAFEKQLKSILKVPIRIENDANAAAWGEFCHTEIESRETMIFITIGTGIGSGIILNGELYRGAIGMAGEFGHTCLVPDGPRCACGRSGCVEACFSAGALIRQVTTAIQDGEQTSLSDIPATALKGKHILRAAESGDTLAHRLVVRGCHLFGQALGNLVNLLNPSQICLGGGVIAAAPYILPLISEGIDSVAIPAARQACQIRPGLLGNTAGIIGAALLAMHSLNQC